MPVLPIVRDPILYHICRQKLGENHKLTQNSQPVVIPWKDVPCDLYQSDSSESEDNTKEAMHEV